MDTQFSQTSPSGLSLDEVSLSLTREGPNELKRAPPRSRWSILYAQLSSALVLLLIGAAALSAVVGEVVDAVAIFAIVVLNAVIGYLQESRAEQAVMALRSLTSPRARVRRGGQVVVIPAAEVVPGDLLLLEGGDIVAADAQLLEAHTLAVSEATLTGESTPVSKEVVSLPEGTPLAERIDRVFMGTTVATGTGVGQVIATGMKTQLGAIAHLLDQAEEGPTPLQKRLTDVGHLLLKLCLGVVAVVALALWLRGEALTDLLLTSISLAVAVVPEGLPVVVTVALAVGVQRMARRGVLVRRLPSVETLGCVTVICTDKTGTLTTGVMVVRELWGPDEKVLLGTAAACCDAELGPELQGVGDPTEVALLQAAAARGIHRPAIEQGNARVEVRPFDSDRRRMAVVRADGKIYVKGAVEVLLPLCGAGTEGAEAQNLAMASRGLRILAVAVGEGSVEENLTLVGLVGIADPPRAEVPEAVAAARGAGVRTIMITGDHPATAEAIAREIGIVAHGDPEGNVRARVTAEEKFNIVRKFRQAGAVVAMTGDGVNDAPALREADVGIAMGLTGTEVTRDAADIILTDDNFASIVVAVREGRGIFDNIRKTLVYLLTGNAGELFLMLLATVLGYPLPLLPLQLLWINLVTDGAPALALVSDPPAPDVLDVPPRAGDDDLLGRRQWMTILWVGLIEMAVTLGVFIWFLPEGVERARSMTFMTLVCAELLRSFAARSLRLTFWEVGLGGNIYLPLSVVGSLMVQVGVMSWGWTQGLFGVSALSVLDMTLALGLGLIPAVCLDVIKLIRRARTRP